MFSFCSTYFVIHACLVHVSIVHFYCQVRTALYGYTVCLSIHMLMSIWIILKFGLITKAGMNICVYLCTYMYFSLG